MPGTAWKKNLKDPNMYEALRRRGMTKQKAAAISNAAAKK